MTRALLHLLLLSLAVAACSTPSSPKKGSSCDGQVKNDVCFETPDQPAIIGQPCKSQVECLNQAACIAGTCKIECLEQWHCEKPLTCDHFRCLAPGDPADVTAPTDVPADVPDDTPDVLDPLDLPTPPELPDAGGKPCTTHVDCGGTAACIEGTCQIKCLADGDCGNADLFDCKQFQCFAVDPPDAGPTDPGPPPVDDGPPPPADIGPELPPGCTAKKGPFGATCHCKQDCASDLCLGDIAAGKGFCTEECFTSDNCPGTAWCFDAEGTKVCVKNDSGAPCSGGCLAFTLQSQAGQCICTSPCDSTKQCPAGMACSKVNGSASKLCVPVGDICQDNGPGSPCFGMCWPDLQNKPFCTAPCTKLTDCPEGMTCFNDVELGGVVCMPK